MDKKKIVLEVLGSVIEEFGFSYDAGSSDKITWCFQRAKVIDAIDIVPEHKYSNKLLGWSYDGEKEFRDNLTATCRCSQMLWP